MAKNTLFHLSSCSTCQRIISALPANDLTLQDIKTEKITPDQLDRMKELSGSYESLFSRRAMKYRSQGWHEKTLNEEDYRRLILEEYTFLKRPVTIIDDKIFVGNTKKVVEALTEQLAK